MTKRHEDVRAELVRGWLNKADADLVSARTLIAHAPGVTASIGFHLQQAVEKSLKAFLAFQGIQPPRTHDITELLTLVRRHDRELAATGTGASDLNPYAVLAIYPEEASIPDDPDMDVALALAERIRRAVGMLIAHTEQLAYVITTSRRTDPELLEHAEQWAQRLGKPLVEREDRSLAQICEDEGVDAVLTVTAERVGLVFPEDDVEYFFHPSMARTRIRNIKEGFGDPMVTAMELAPGDSLLDCTLGRATDATVASWVVGEEGRVVGYEAEPLLAQLTMHGLASYEIDGAGVQEAMRRIDAREGDCRVFLPQLETGSFDVVYFDPFFEEMLKQSQSMKPLRRIGLHEPIPRETYDEARRVASRLVVIKQKCGESLPGVPEPDRVVSGGGSRVEYLVVECSN